MEPEQQNEQKNGKDMMEENFYPAKITTNSNVNF